VRIGTWNVANRVWTDRHIDLVESANCDVWLLTETNRSVDLPGFEGHLTNGVMGHGQQRWAGVFSRRPLQPLADPHPASAAAVIDGTTYCSTILPWKGAAGEAPWSGHSHADRTRNALDVLLANLPTTNLVWGGDWNHSLCGREEAGSIEGRRHVVDAVQRLGLCVPTCGLAHPIRGLRTIDHIAVPADFAVDRVERIKAKIHGLSDHDAYVVEVADA
jgi:hypothetical protein